MASGNAEDLAAAVSSKTSPDELGKLALSSDPEVRAAALDNPKTPQWAKNRVLRNSEIPEEPARPRPADSASNPVFLNAEVRKQTQHLQAIRWGLFGLLGLIALFFAFNLLSSCSAGESKFEKTCREELGGSVVNGVCRFPIQN